MMGMVEEALLVPIVVFLPFQTSGLILASYILIKLAQW